MARRQITQKQREERIEGNVEWRLHHIELLSWLFSQGEEAHPFLRSMQEAVQQWGALTPKQEAAVEKWHAKDSDRQAEKQISEDAPALTEGRRLIVGEVISAKQKYTSRYGGAVTKITVALDDGNKVWGTMPSALSEDAIKGERISFTATVTPSDRDEHFGFFKRPSEGEYVGEKS
jgi:hypothetical protein